MLLTKPSRCSADDPQTLNKDLRTSFETNVIGVINTVNTFIPLLRKGQEKKVFTLSTGAADIDLINQSEIAVAAPYAISKAGLNAAVAKYNALYKKEGFLFMAISPGLVDTGELVPGELFEQRPIGDCVHSHTVDPNNVEDTIAFQDMASKFAAYAQHATAPITPQESVSLMLDLFERSSIEKGNGGAFVSQYGNKQWL